MCYKYEELIRSCRACATGYVGNCDSCMFSGKGCYKQLHKASADAITELCNLCADMSKINSYAVAKYLALWEKQPRWIPVTERLPERNGSYLVYVYGEVTEMDYWLGKWHMLRDDYTKAVTHWMPFPSAPEPPKEVR